LKFGYARWSCALVLCLIPLPKRKGNSFKDDRNHVQILQAPRVFSHNFLSNGACFVYALRVRWQDFAGRERDFGEVLSEILKEQKKVRAVIG